MTTRRIIVALSVVAVLGVLAVMVTLSLNAAPTAAQTPPSEPTPAPPEATPEPISAKDAETLAEMKQHCRDGEIYDLYFSVNDADDGQGKTLLLEWWGDLSYWDLPDGMVAYYRIQRRDADGGEWQTVATVNNTNVWEGSVGTGHWQYRVGLIGLTYGDLVHECQTTNWGTTEVNVLTLQEELEQLCETLYVYHVAADVEPSSDGQGETVTLLWYLDIHYYYYGYYFQPPKETMLNFRVERIHEDSDQDEGSWEKVASVETELDHENTWSGPGEPGDWIYRIALVSVQAGDAVGQCEKPHWSQVEVFVPTAEERAQEEADRLVLIEQASACALDALSDNFTPAARSVIGRYIDKRVGEIVEDAEFEGVVTMTVMFCTDRETQERRRQPSRVEYILDVLFDGGYW